MARATENIRFRIELANFRFKLQVHPHVSGLLDVQTNAWVSFLTNLIPAEATGHLAKGFHQKNQKILETSITPHAEHGFRHKQLAGHLLVNLGEWVSGFLIFSDVYWYRMVSKNFSGYLLMVSQRT